MNKNKSLFKAQMEVRLSKNDNPRQVRVVAVLPALTVVHPVYRENPESELTRQDRLAIGAVVNDLRTAKRTIGADLFLFQGKDNAWAVLPDGDKTKYVPVIEDGEVKWFVPDPKAAVPAPKVATLAPAEAESTK